jgi:hypothetical protein
MRSSSLTLTTRVRRFISHPLYLDPLLDVDELRSFLDASAHTGQRFCGDLSSSFRWMSLPTIINPTSLGAWDHRGKESGEAAIFSFSFSLHSRERETRDFTLLTVRG